MNFGLCFETLLAIVLCYTLAWTKVCVCIRSKAIGGYQPCHSLYLFSSMMNAGKQSFVVEVFKAGSQKKPTTKRRNSLWTSLKPAKWYTTTNKYHPILRTSTRLIICFVSTIIF